MGDVRSYRLIISIKIDTIPRYITRPIIDLVRTNWHIICILITFASDAEEVDRHIGNRNLDYHLFFAIRVSK